MKAKMITLIVATAAVLFSASAYSDTIKPAIVNVDGLSDECAVKQVSNVMIVVCPLKDKELLTKIINENKETHND